MAVLSRIQIMYIKSVVSTVMNQYFRFDSKVLSTMGGQLLNIVGKPATSLQGHYWTDRNTAGQLELTERKKKIFHDFQSAKAAFDSWIGNTKVTSEMQMDRATVIEKFETLRQWRRAGERAPHKPLLVLYAIRKLLRDGVRLISYSEVDENLGKLLRELGTKRTRYKPQDPFWRLRALMRNIT